MICRGPFPLLFLLLSTPPPTFHPAHAPLASLLFPQHARHRGICSDCSLTGISQIITLLPPSPSSLLRCRFYMRPPLNTLFTIAASPNSYSALFLPGINYFLTYYVIYVDCLAPPTESRESRGFVSSSWMHCSGLTVPAHCRYLVNVKEMKKY